MRALRFGFVFLLLCLLSAGPLEAAKQKPLAARIATILNQPDLDRGFWGIEAVSLKTGKVLYSQNSDKLFTPASNTKLFTTSAALALIGPDDRRNDRPARQTRAAEWRSAPGGARGSESFRQGVAVRSAHTAERPSDQSARGPGGQPGAEGWEVRGWGS